MIEFNTGEHRPVLINCRMIAAIQAAGRGTTIRLMDGSEIWVSQSYYDVIQRVRAELE